MGREKEERLARLDSVGGASSSRGRADADAGERDKRPRRLLFPREEDATDCGLIESGEGAQRGGSY